MRDCISISPLLKIKTLKSFINKHLSAFLVLLLLSTSVLSANHVHEAHDQHSDQIEQCLVYHIADHQQTAEAYGFNFVGVPSHQQAKLLFQNVRKQGSKKPSARAPPLNA